MIDDEKMDKMKKLKDDFEDTLDLNSEAKERLNKALWKVSYWVIIGVAIMLVFLLLPFIFSQTAKIIVASSEIKKALKPAS
jgi:hypothetical protein